MWFSSCYTLTAQSYFVGLPLLLNNSTFLVTSPCSYVFDDISFLPFHYFYWCDQGAFSPVFLLIFCKFYLPFISLMAAFPFLCSQSRSHVFLLYLKKSCHQFLPYPRSSIISFSPDSNKIKLLKYAHSPFSCCSLLPALLTMKLWEWNYLVLFPISDC